MKLNKDFFKSEYPIAYLQNGEVGGKAQGLEFIYSKLLTELKGDAYRDFKVSIPKMIVLRTNAFDEFMKNNKLYDVALSGASDHRIASAFQQANLPFKLLSGLQLIATEMKNPLVVRSSSLLEDAMHEPFAGIYGTKMTPNNQLDQDKRFRKLVEAIKFVYASTFFKTARDYIKATKNESTDEKMAVIIQEIIGSRFEDIFYPEISGVIKSYNYYSADNTKAEDGIVNLALGLGRQIVDGGASWGYCPKQPEKGPPFKSTDNMLKETQLKFWAVNMGKVPEYNPIHEAEFLVETSMRVAEKNGSLKHLVSTYDYQSNRIWDGQAGQGARILTFAPILKHSTVPLNPLVGRLMQICEKAYGCPVEIEFAISLAKKEQDAHRFGFLQVRPMVVSDEVIDIEADELGAKENLLRSDYVLGNGSSNSISDIVYMKRLTFDAGTALKIAAELEDINQKMQKKDKKYLLIGFGRWGTSDPWAGIPVSWGQISEARIIVETSMEGMNQQMSQASHFFHNVSSFKVFYFSVPGNSENDIDWDWLNDQEAVEETDHIRHIEVNDPLLVKVDGRKGQGLIRKY